VKKLIGALCALGLLVGSGVAVATEDTHAVKVFVGYADTFVSPAVSATQGAHPGPGFTPSPWLGSSGVIFIGVAEPTTGTFDAGAIRLDNPSEEALTVDNVTVDIGTLTGIDPWSGCGVAPPCKSVFPFTIPGKGTAILTQTFVPGQPSPPLLQPSPPLPGVGAFNFDTSDIPTPGNCVADGLTPLVHVTVGSSNQNTKDFVDDTQVLNTGGVDLGGCVQSPANEGHDWVEVHEGQ
jgi:hypothetical protein